MRRAQQADIALHEQPPLEEAGLQLRQQPDGQVDLPASIASRRLMAVLRTVLSVTPGAARASSSMRRGSEVDLADVGHGRS